MLAAQAGRTRSQGPGISDKNQNVTPRCGQERPSGAEQVFSTAPAPFRRDADEQRNARPSPEPSSRRRDRPRCGAKTRAGGACLVRVEPGKARCRFHGGLSTGPKTEAGRNRIAEAQRLRWLAYRENKL